MASGYIQLQHVSIKKSIAPIARRCVTLLNLTYGAAVQIPNGVDEAKVDSCRRGNPSSEPLQLKRVIAALELRGRALTRRLDRSVFGTFAIFDFYPPRPSTAFILPRGARRTPFSTVTGCESLLPPGICQAGPRQPIVTSSRKHRSTPFRSDQTNRISSQN